ncbi:glycolate oxidase subunit GlcE [Rhodocyclus gracilis]|uniref:Glycolate oxidase subunit GlcE n=1 Tax=Rhodocyclus tenuis TaxID=1066 RepID=A0A6L5JT54_RHOTE|nr:glycolate oxidase subunit GlcE [Rhodocyclus gracilis]MQY50587.1 glycolate oxidase subunit GlcE [Rhodocyclus gracilis]
MKAIHDRWCERVRAAAADGRPLRLRGSGSKDFYGQPLLPGSGEVFDTREYRGIVAYSPSELVVTARCGTPLAELEAALAAQGQMLAFEPPHFGPQATVGGMLAAGLSGPRRSQAGALRDYVLGVRLIDGEGRALSFGGQVMKNVAGYDVPRLLAGSLGTLALVTEVSLKTLPRPVAERTLVADLGEGEALRRLAAWNALPLPLSASAWFGGRLSLRLSGAAAAVASSAAALQRELRAAGVAVGHLPEDEAAVFWRSLREQTHPFFSATAPAGDARQFAAGVVGAEPLPLWRLALRATTPPVRPAADGAEPASTTDAPGGIAGGATGTTLIEWGGALRWRRDGDPLALRAAAAAAGGHATLFRGDAPLKSAIGAFAPLPPPLAAIHRRLKNAFDAPGVFNPGRLFREF